MDERMDDSLREQERALRAVLDVLSRAVDRARGLGGGAGWVGPASAAYDAAVFTLRLELLAAEGSVSAALRDTMSAITVGEVSGG